MARYRKGANAERELIHKLFKMGFSVARVAGSGSTSLPSPDIIALNKTKILAIECKAWSQAYLNIPLKQMAELRSWSTNAGADFYIAWKIPHKGWFFLPAEIFKRTKKAYTISMKKALKQSLDIGVVTGQQKQLGAKITKRNKRTKTSTNRN